MFLWFVPCDFFGSPFYTEITLELEVSTWLGKNICFGCGYLVKANNVFYDVWKKCLWVKIFTWFFLTESSTWILTH